MSVTKSKPGNTFEMHHHTIPFQFDRKKIEMPRPVKNANTTEAVYAFIYQFRQEHDFSPSLREIGAACFIGRSTVYRHLDKLEAQGRIAREPGCARGITLLDPKANP